MGLDYNVLKNAIIKFHRRGYGANQELAEKAGLDPNITSKIARGKTRQPTLKTWEALHKAWPKDMPAPSFEEERPKAAANADVVRGALLEVPVFDAGAGEPSSFTDGGYPVGSSDEFIPIIRNGADENAFGVRIHGESMWPTLDPGDIALVVPGQDLAQGKLCFATWHGDEGDRLVKRYFKYGSVVVLKSDNPDKKAYPDIELGNGGAPEEGPDEPRIMRVTMVMKKDP